VRKVVQEEGCQRVKDQYTAKVMHVLPRVGELARQEAFRLFGVKDPFGYVFPERLWIRFSEHQRSTEGEDPPPMIRFQEENSRVRHPGAYGHHHRALRRAAEFACARAPAWFGDRPA